MVGVGSIDKYRTLCIITIEVPVSWYIYRYITCRFINVLLYCQCTVYFENNQLTKYLLKLHKYINKYTQNCCYYGMAVPKTYVHTAVSLNSQFIVHPHFMVIAVVQILPLN